jgi:hypothetical protein
VFISVTWTAEPGYLAEHPADIFAARLRIPQEQGAMTAHSTGIFLVVLSGAAIAAFVFAFVLSAALDQQALQDRGVIETA